MMRLHLPPRSDRDADVFLWKRIAFYELKYRKVFSGCQRIFGNVPPNRACRVSVKCRKISIDLKKPGSYTPDRQKQVLVHHPFAREHEELKTRMTLKRAAIMAAGLFLAFHVFIAPAESFEGPVIVDHTCTDLTKIPQNRIQTAKSNLHIAYGHTSHGSQLTDGMTGLVQFINNGGLGLSRPENFFAWNQGGADGALDLHDYAMAGDCGYYPDWVANTRDYLGSPNPVTGRGTAHPNTNVIIWSWCGQVSQKYRNGTLFSEYIDPMSQLEKDYPGVRFVYMTGHVDHEDDAANKAANAAIRSFCRDHGKTLYDFADIESYDPNGTLYAYPHDNCDYYASATGSLLGNWAIAWQNSHTEGRDWYNCPSAHSQPLNANLKAYAAWWLWARLAGWDGKSETRKGKPLSFPQFLILDQ